MHLTKFAFTDKGRRTNNEDAIYPDPAISDNNIFIVCDGVGGAQKGEVASELVSTELYSYLRQHNCLNSELIDAALVKVESKLEEHINQNPYSEGMATTLTLCVVQDREVYLAHIGDSKIFFIRQGRLHYMSEDHSLVNEMVKKGLLTAQDAEVHPKRNVITKAVTAEGGHIPSEIKVISNLQEGDLIFLCTDGVTEAINEQNIVDLLVDSRSDLEKIDFIQSKCQVASKDNYSGYLIRANEIG